MSYRVKSPDAVSCGYYVSGNGGYRAFCTSNAYCDTYYPDLYNGCTYRKRSCAAAYQSDPYTGEQLYLDCIYRCGSGSCVGTRADYGLITGQIVAGPSATAVGGYTITFSDLEFAYCRAVPINYELFRYGKQLLEIMVMLMQYSVVRVATPIYITRDRLLLTHAHGDIIIRLNMLFIMLDAAIMIIILVLTYPGLIVGLVVGLILSVKKPIAILNMLLPVLSKNEVNTPSALGRPLRLLHALLLRKRESFYHLVILTIALLAMHIHIKRTVPTNHELSDVTSDDNE